MYQIARRCGCHAVAILLATTVGCAPKSKQQGNAKPPTASRVAFRTLGPEAASSGPRVRAPCPVDLSLRDVSCPAQSAVVEVRFSADGRVASSRISRSSGIQALDLGCMLAASSCVVGQSSQPAALECSLQCE